VHDLVGIEALIRRAPAEDGKGKHKRLIGDVLRVLTVLGVLTVLVLKVLKVLKVLEVQSVHLAP
jgi:uncharacterized metal-binding protein